MSSYSGLEGLPPEQREAMLARVVLEVALTFPEGHQPRVMTRSWTRKDIGQEPGMPELGDAAEHTFLVNPTRSWPNPQDPIFVKADVVPGREYDAREWLDLL